MSRTMFGNPKDDPWANKQQGNDDDDDWDTDPDFENKETIKQGSKKEEIVSAAEAQRQLRGELEDDRAKKFGVATAGSVDRGNYQDPGPSRTQPTKTWNPQQELAGKSSVSAAKNAFSQPSYQEPERPAPRQAPKPAPAPAPVQHTPPPKPAAPPAKAAPPPPVKATPPPPAPKPAAPAPPPPAPAPVEESWDDQGGYDQGGYDQGGYDQGGDQGGYDQGGYDQGGYDQGGYDQGGYDQGGYDQGGYDQGGYDQGGDQGYDQGGYDQGFLGTCRALYDYPGENETDLRFNAGDIISIVNDSDPSGWWEGDLNGARGYFPSNFVERV